MKILLLSFYDLGKQPKIISELNGKLLNGVNTIDIIDYSIEDKDIELENYDVLGIYASMHTASVLAEEYLRDKQLPSKLFVFGLYANVFSEMFLGSTSSVTSEAMPFLKLLIPLATSPIKLDIFPLPKRRTTKTATIAICVKLIPIKTYSLFK